MTWLIQRFRYIRVVAILQTNCWEIIPPKAFNRAQVPAPVVSSANHILDQPPGHWISNHELRVQIHNHSQRISLCSPTEQGPHGIIMHLFNQSKEAEKQGSDSSCSLQTREFSKLQIWAYILPCFQRRRLFKYKNSDMYINFYTKVNKPPQFTFSLWHRNEAKILLLG